MRRSGGCILARSSESRLAATLVVSLLTVGDPARLTGGYLFHRRLAEAAAAHQARIDFVSIPQRPFPLAIVDGGSALRRAGERAHVLVLDSIAAAFVGPWLSLSPPKRPLVGMLHQPPGGIDHGALRTTLQVRLDRLAYRRARRLLVASESLRDRLVRDGVAAERLVVVPPGRDVATVAGRHPGDLRRGRRAAFLAVGNWVERKGFHALLEAFSRLPSDAATLHLVGDESVDPPYAARLRHRLARPDLAERVVVHGPLPREDVAALYAAADAFVLPSFREPYGTVWGEAMAFGLPVVGWRAENLPYLAQHEREGLLVETGDIAALATALRRLAEDARLREELGRTARRRALTRPTWDEVAAQFFAQVRDPASGGR